MTTPTNWPNPERPGVPLFPEYVGEHILLELRSGEERRAFWNNEQSCWNVVALYEQTPKTVAKYFHYVQCKCVMLTTTQIAEMLAGERERCAVIAEDNTVSMENSDTESAVNELLEITAREIRNLGDAP